MSSSNKTSINNVLTRYALGYQNPMSWRPFSNPSHYSSFVSTISSERANGGFRGFICRYIGIWCPKTSEGRSTVAPKPPFVSSLIKKLENDDPLVKIEAARKLGKIGPVAVKAVPALIEVLSNYDNGPNVRRAAAEALGKIGPAAVKAVPALIKGLGSSEKIIKFAATVALGKIGPAANDALLKTLNDGECNTKQNVAIALGEIGWADTRTIAALIKASADREWIVRDEAIIALGKLGRLAAPAVPALIRALADRKWIVRKKAAIALGKIGPAAAPAIPALIRILLKDSFSSYILETLVKIGSSSVPVLITIMTSTKKDVFINIKSSKEVGNSMVVTTRISIGKATYINKEDVSKALAKIGYPAVSALIEVLDNESYSTSARSFAARTLGMIGPIAVSSVSTLIRALGNEDCNIRCEVIKALSRIAPTDPRTVTLLIGGLLKDEDDDVKKEAAKLLGRIAPTDPLTIAAFGKVILKEDEDARVKAAVMGELIKVGSAAASVVPNLIRLLRNGNSMSKYYSALVLGKIGPAAAAAIPVLIKALKNKNRSVIASAAKALGEIGHAAAKAIPALNKILDSGDPVLSEIARVSLVKIRKNVHKE